MGDHIICQLGWAVSSLMGHKFCISGATQNSIKVISNGSRQQDQTVAVIKQFEDRADDWKGVSTVML